MITREFEQEYSKLNQAQKEAVDSIEGPVMVIAGPGTGKTTILTLRAANILRLTDTPASGILALTFTENGAKNMRLKLREIIGVRADEVRIHTFHGFAASVIAEFQDHFPHLSRAIQITEVESETIIRDILKEEKFLTLRPFGEPDFYVPKIISTISDAKQEAWTPEMLHNFAKDEIDRIKTDENSISTRGASKGNLKAEALKRIEKNERTILLSEVYELYEKIKKEEKKMDYDDLLFELLKALREDKLLLQMLQEKFLYILVDEHQDTNDTQNLIIQSLADFFESPNLFVVGDEKQAIYRFQGASVSNFLNFQKNWPAMKIISLVQNYRSHQSILDASHQMIEQNYDGNIDTELYKNLRIRLLSQPDREVRPIDIMMAANADAEEKFLVENISKILKNESHAQIAIITRRNREIEKLLGLLEENNIKAKAERGADIFSHPVGVLFFALLEFLSNPEKIEFLAQTIAGGLWDLEFENQVSLIKQIRSGKLDDIEKEIPMLKTIKEALHEESPVSFIILVADLSGLTTIAKQDPLSIEIWRGLLNLAESAALQNEIRSPKELLGNLLEYRKTAAHRSIKIVAGNATAQVTIMTAHGSKGLEFDYIFVPYALEEVWIGRKRGSYFTLPKEEETGDEIKDERRLFYVALTRAKRHAFISMSLESLGKSFTPLRFISELDPAHVKYTDLPAYQKPLKPTTEKVFKNKKKERQTEYTKNVLLESGLSVTALNHFLESPKLFFEKSILKVPEAPTPSSEKGVAMHESLSNVWREIKKLESSKVKKLEPEEITGIIKTSIKNYFAKSFLPLYEKGPLVKELLEDAETVAECLVPHFQIEGEVFTEMQAESRFSFNNPLNPPYNKGETREKIDITLHGRLDTVIKQGDRVLVFDYKTREGMSEKAIRGETQNDDGNYFRQLVFYKLLLGGNPELSLVFIRPDSKGHCPIITLEVTDSDIAKLKSEISNLIETVWSGKLIS